MTETSRQRGRVARRGPSGLLFFCRDLPSGPRRVGPQDSYLLALAEASQAEFLVTGKELLFPKQQKSTRIITPAAIIEDPEKKLRVAECQILAGFEHGNIARRLRGGTTDEGHPYFTLSWSSSKGAHR